MFCIHGVLKGHVVRHMVSRSKTTEHENDSSKQDGTGVVITGMGVLSPIGIGHEPYWESLCTQRSGVELMPEIASLELPAKIGGTVKDFDPKQHAFYYLRVLEIPTPTWIAKDIAFYGVKAPDDATLVHQERGYSSPVWYQPK